jgi:ribonuclease HII
MEPIVAKKPRVKKEHVALLPFKDAAHSFEIGIDEAGRGPLFGRVYVAAVVLPKEPSCLSYQKEPSVPKEPETKDTSDQESPFRYDWMRDSKQIKSRKKIGELAAYIKSNALAWHIHYAEADEIDRSGILNCVIRGMHICIDEIARSFVSKQGFALNSGLLLVDGNYFRPYTFFNQDTETLKAIPHETVEKGDGTYASIAAASILAKNERDTYVEELCAKHPVLSDRYGLHTNMGYGTKAHLEGIRTHGITEWHRQTFRGAAGEPLNKVVEDATDMNK